MSPAAQTQEALIPLAAPEYEPVDVEMKLIEPPQASEPDARFVRSIERLGVCERVKLKPIRRGAYRYSVEDGRRRFLAARKLGHATIRSEVRRDTVARLSSEVVALSMNANRSDNAALDLGNIESLQRAGASEDEIFEATGVTKQRQRALLRLAGLEARLRRGFDEGAIVTPVAAAAAKLTQPLQERLAQRFQETEALTAQDVKEVRQAQLAAAAGENVEMFGGEGYSWKPSCIRALRSALKAVPEDETELTADITAILVKVEPLRLVRDTE